MAERHFGPLLASILALVSCTASTPQASPRTAHRSAPGLAARAAQGTACVRPTLRADGPYRLPLAGAVEDPALLPYLTTVPAEVRRIAIATGLEPSLAATLQDQAEHGEDLTLARLERRQAMSALLGSLDSQLASVSFEIDCTGDVLEDLLAEFERREHARELKLTIASLVTGAVAGVVAASWDARDREGSGPAITAGVGAGATALLGVAAFVPHRRVVDFRHERNLLAPIARGDDPTHIYPSFVFRLLSAPLADGSASPARDLTMRWQTLLAAHLPAARHAEAERLLFGAGGVYSEALLELRQTMLDQLESRVGALYRDLELLERYLTRVTTRDAAVAPVAPVSPESDRRRGSTPSP